MVGKAQSQSALRNQIIDLFGSIRPLLLLGVWSLRLSIEEVDAR